MPPDAHLLLDIDPKLDWIPWELLCDAGQFLCLRFCVGRALHHFSLKEHHALRTRMAAARPGIAFVAVGATDDLKAAMDEGDEVRAILRSRYKRDVPCDRMPSRDVLLGQILKSYDVFHFCGHGAFEPDDSAHTGWRCRKGGILSCKD